MIGDKSADGLYLHYFKTKCHSVVPDTHVDSVESKVGEHLQQELFGLPLKDPNTVTSILGTVVANQGGFLERDLVTLVEAIAQTIQHMVNLTVQPPPSIYVPSPSMSKREYISSLS